MFGVEQTVDGGIREESRMMILADISVRVFMPHNSESRCYY